MSGGKLDYSGLLWRYADFFPPRFPPGSCLDSENNQRSPSLPPSFPLCLTVSMSLQPSLCLHCDCGPLSLPLSPSPSAPLLSLCPPLFSSVSSSSSALQKREPWCEPFLPLPHSPLRMTFLKRLRSVKNELILFLTPLACLPLPLVIGTPVSMALRVNSNPMSSYAHLNPCVVFCCR